MKILQMNTDGKIEKPRISYLFETFRYFQSFEFAVENLF